LETMTGGRIKRVKKYIGDETFMITYGDGVCDVNVAELVSFHKGHGKKATITSVVQQQTKGTIDVLVDNTVRAFREKNIRDAQYINAGYMVFEPEVFDYLKGDDTVLETNVLSKLAEEQELMSFQHKGFWQCMDTLSERNLLERLYRTNKAPWVKW